MNRWLDKAQSHAEQKKYDVNVLLNARLAPDQFPFARQIQVLSDNAKGMAARFAGVQPPSFEDNEKTLEELRARIDKTIAFLKTLTPEQFQGAAERTITLPFFPGKGLKAMDYLIGFALPNFCVPSRPGGQRSRSAGSNSQRRDAPSGGARGDRSSGQGRGAPGARRAVPHGDPPALSTACRAALLADHLPRPSPATGLLSRLYSTR